MTGIDHDAIDAIEHLRREQAQIVPQRLQAVAGVVRPIAVAEHLADGAMLVGQFLNPVNGFARARCPDCGHDFLVAFSCKGRIDGVFEPVEAVEEAGDIPQSVRFRPAAELTPEALAAIAEQVRVRVLRWLARSGLIEPDDVRELLAWENSGFSLDAAVRVGAHDRAGLKRLLRDCARPPFALERLERLDDERVVYRLPKPQRDGTTALALTPLALIDHLVAQLVHRLAPAQAASPSPPWRARAKRAPAGGCHRRSRADAGLGPPQTTRARVRARSARLLVAAVSLPRETVWPPARPAARCAAYAPPSIPGTRAPAPRATSVSPAVGR